MNTYSDPGPAVEQPSVRLRTEARQAERDAAKQAVGRAGSWRRRIFDIVVRQGAWGATSREIAAELGRQTPCEDCGCIHRPPIPVNQVATRLGELREWGYLYHPTNREGDPITRKGAEVHKVTVLDAIQEEQ